MTRPIPSPTPMPPTVSIVIVCMNNLEDLLPCLDSIQAQTTRTSVEIWVVAYLFSPGNLARLKAAHPEVQVVESNEIRGFSENNNLALRQVSGEFCLILNDDTVMNMPVVDRLVESFGQEPRAAMFSPKILNRDGSVQACGRAPWTIWSSVLNGFRIRDAQRAKSPFINKTGIFQTYNVSGSAFMIRTSVLKELGFFDEQYFFCPEDIALSTLANERGHACFVNADILLVHKACSTLGKTAEATFPALGRGSVLFHGRNSRVKALLYRLILWLLAAAKYVHAYRKPPAERIRWKRIWRNTMTAALSRKTPKELFIQFYTNPKDPEPAGVSHV
jgi:GT2 family glycosyltransferase